MAFNLNSLLDVRTLLPEVAEEFREAVSQLIVSGIPHQLHLIDLHQALQTAFGRMSPPVKVDLREADFREEELFQECKLTFCPAVDKDAAESGVRDTLEDMYGKNGLHLPESVIFFRPRP